MDVEDIQVGDIIRFDRFGKEIYWVEYIGFRNMLLGIFCIRLTKELKRRQNIGSKRFMPGQLKNLELVRRGVPESEL